MSVQFRGHVAPLNVVWKWLVPQKCQQDVGDLLGAKILLLPQGKLSIKDVNARNAGPGNNRPLLKGAAVLPALRIVPFKTATKTAAPYL